ncbi:MAG: BCCT family transporter [Alphaproteobacteria bacterium]
MPDPAARPVPKPAYQICAPVFFGSAILIVGFVIFGATLPDLAGSIFAAVQTWITGTFGWFYVLTVAIFIVFAFGLAFSAYGTEAKGEGRGASAARPGYRRPDTFASSSSFGSISSAASGGTL